MLYFRVRATLAQFPVVAVFVASKTHKLCIGSANQFKLLIPGAHEYVGVTNVLGNVVCFKCNDGINQTQNADEWGRDQHVRIETQPGEVQSEFYTEIFFNFVDGLEFYAVFRPRPFS